MDQSKKYKKPEEQFEYLGRWVNKLHFRAFVYNEKCDQRLAENYEQFESLTASGIWFASKPDASQKPRKQKDVIRTDS